MKAIDIIHKVPGPFALAGVLAILSAMFVGWGNLGTLAWAKDTDQQVKDAVQPLSAQVQQMAKNIEDQAKEAKDTKAQQFARDIFAAVIEKCEAKRRGSSARAWTERIQTLKVEYQKLTGIVYAEPECEDL